MGIIIITTTTY